MSKFNIILNNNNILKVNSYILDFENFSVVIDPSQNYDDIDGKIKEKLKAVFITHGHFDHFLFLESYKEKNLTFYMHEKAYEKINDSSKNASYLIGEKIECDLSNEELHFVNDKEIVRFSNIEFLIHEFLGHTDCSIGIEIEKKLFSGDFIFKGSIGRTDLYSGDKILMQDSIDKILEYDEDIEIFPGHNDKTRLKDEKENNPYLKR